MFSFRRNTRWNCNHQVESRFVIAANRIDLRLYRINLFNVNDPPSLTINGNATELSKTYVQYGDPVAVFESLVISDEDSFIQK